MAELRRVLKHGRSIHHAIDYFNFARALVLSDSPRAVALCRVMVEALDKRLEKQGFKDSTEHLKACTDQHRGRQYGRIFSSVKQLENLNWFAFGRSSTFTRPEALALVRLCKALLLMIGELSRDPRHEVNEATHQGD